MELSKDPIYQRVYVSKFDKSGSAFKICKDISVTNRNFLGTFITHVNNTPVFTKGQALTHL